MYFYIYPRLSNYIGLQKILSTKRYVCYNRKCGARALIDLKNRNQVYFPNLSVSHDHPNSKKKEIHHTILKAHYTQANNTSGSTHKLLASASNVAKESRPLSTSDVQIRIKYTDNDFDATGTEKAINSVQAAYTFAEDSPVDQDELNYDNGRDLNSSGNDEGPERKVRRKDGNDTVLQEALNCMKSLIDTSTKRDEHSIYGEHIAHKFRTCNRGNSEINIAQHHIEKIIFDLSMGVYKTEALASDAANGKINIDVQQSPAVSTAPTSIEPAVIPKIELDL